MPEQKNSPYIITPGAEKRFWLFFIILNFIPFLPAYLFNADSSSFFPVKSFTQSYWAQNVWSFFKRENYDIFRFSVDLSLLTLLYYFLRNKISSAKFSLFASGYFLILILFLVYYHAMYKIFLVEPILYNDISLFKLGYQNLGPNSLLIILLIILATSALFYLFYVLFLRLFGYFQAAHFGKASRIIMLSVAFILLINFIKSGLTINAHSVFQVGIGKLVENFQNSVVSANNLSKVDVPNMISTSHNYKTYSLDSKPDIYLLFVESYGKIVYDDSSFQMLYSQINKECEKELRQNGWHSASDFSVSPISGGGSWISFSSVMFGVNLKNHSTYSYFLRNTEFQNYTNILKYFRNQGYKSYWINPLPDNKKMKIPWNLYANFYGVDRWVNYHDLDYHGQFFGFGPAPPDQYSLFKGKQVIDNIENGPRIVFYITENSHNPFYSPDSLANDWQALNTGLSPKAPPSIFAKKPKASDYIKAINYELQMLTRFIVKSDNKNTIYILIGDHQPPVLSNNKNGFETPVHIIAQDSALVANFYNYGFTEGLYVTNSARKIKHEAIYSMLLREILRRHGTSTNKLPEYLPVGMEY